MAITINKTYLIIALVTAVLCSLVTYHFTAKYYSAKYDTLNEDYTNFKAQYSSIVKEKEDAVIAQALAEKKAKTPVKELVKGDTVTEIQYVEKESKKDSGLEMTSTVDPVSVTYNGKTEELATKTTDGKEIVDGKFVVTQKSSTTIDIDAIVKREIANRILEDENQRLLLEHDKDVLKRQKLQNTIWGTVAGVAIGRLTN